MAPSYASERLDASCQLENMLAFVAPYRRIARSIAQSALRRGRVHSYKITISSGKDKYGVSQHKLALWSRELWNQWKAAQSSPFVLPIFGWCVEVFQSTACLLVALPLCDGPIVQKDADTRQARSLPEEFQPYKLLWTIEVAEALAVLHGLKIVHCDVQSQNIFIWMAPNGDRHALLADFGCSLCYGQPEQVEGEHEQALGRKKQLDLRLLALAYLDMAYGGKTAAMDSTQAMAGEINIEAYEELSVEKMAPGSDLDRKLQERAFLKNLSECKMPASEVKNVPFFSSVIPESECPRWADDLRKLSGGRSHSFVSKDPWRSLGNFLLVPNPVGKDAESELIRVGIKWKPISATLLEQELKEEVKRLQTPTSSSSSSSEKSTSDKSDRK
ncbi:hypothetical protein AAVH_24487 [Aphelenchoides avenae]|nr:hypothetical protein AAVH_24487 [Aphelenchus avenae]